MTEVIERLINNFKPENYNIELILDFENLQFDGKVIIRGSKLGNKDKIRLHSKALDIKNISINEQKAKYSLEGDELVIDYVNKPGRVNIDIDFSGKITKAMHGIYPSYAANGKIIISTQFESHHAREAFPCVDEPEAKATFDLTISAPKKVKVLGNMPVAKEAADGPNRIVKFKTTPIMSTYLLAFAAGDMQGVSKKSKGGTLVSAWSSLDHPKDNLNFAVDTAANTLDFLEEYFGVKYPLPKLDQVALPDFSSGAMENWGLVTYREIALLVDPKKASTASKEMVALVIAHELSHQWFGNLVTMRWWDDLWLNESFATLMEYIVIDNLYPEWNVMLSFTSHEALSAFRRDILPGVQAVSTKVNHPDEISTLFDPSIVYAKGARLLWMVYNLVGEINFKKGLKYYFDKHKFANTEGGDLWEALGRASNIDVKSIMKAWLSRPGLPFLNIEFNGDEIKLKQQQLTSAGAKNGFAWPIPLWPSRPLRTDILKEQAASLKTASSYVRFNTVGGHYVCNYLDHNTRQDIRNDLINKNLSPSERLLVLNDAMLLSKCAIVPIHQMLDTLKAFETEDQEAIWGVMSLAIGDVKMLAEEDNDTEKHLKRFVFELVKDKLDQLGWQTNADDTTNDIKLRSIVMGMAIYSDNQESLDRALKIYRSSTIDKIDSNLRASALSVAVKKGSQDDFEHLISEYPKQTNSDIKIDIASAICLTKKTNQIKSVLSKLKDDNFVKLQDVDRFLIYLLRNKVARPFAWEWMTTNWSWIEENFASDKSYDSYPRYAASCFSTKEWLIKYKKHFLAYKDVPALSRNIELGIKDIENKIAWRNKEIGDLKSWLKDQ